jgi:RNA polymerase sigma-70 factor (ECF subfamily)
MPSDAVNVEESPAEGTLAVQALNEELSQSPEELAARARAGCERSFESLVFVFAGRIYNFLFQMTRNTHDAEDLTQETFVRAFRNIQKYDSKYGFSTWLFTIAKRTALSHFRSARRAKIEPFEEGHSPVDTSDPSREAESREDSGSIWSLARTLKPNQHEALWLRYGEGFSVEQMASVMGTTRIYAKVLLHRARTNLTKLVRKNEKIFNRSDFALE